MLNLLSQVYRSFPEEGDLEKPKLVLFIDEAHLVFKQASPALLRLLDTIVKLIRSKGIGLIFCTQTPKDIPENILGQLGLKIQHVLRSFTAKDRKAIRLVAQNFPPSAFYDIEHLLTNLGTGEALVTALDSDGAPTPLIQCRLRAPESRMGVLESTELAQLLRDSALMKKYGKRVNRDSAKEQIVAQKAEPSSAPERNTSSKKKRASLQCCGKFE